jgi:hypothetical protein
VSLLPFFFLFAFRGAEEERRKGREKADAAKSAVWRRDDIEVKCDGR